MNCVVRYSVGDVVPDAFLAVPSREQVQRLEDSLYSLPRVETPITHHFSEGIYARQMDIPAGTVVTGKIHKRPHLFMVIQGDISVLTETGVKRLQAPAILEGKPGIKRAAFAHTDSVCVAIHGTHEKDLDVIEHHFTANNFEEFEQFLLEQK